MDLIAKTSTGAVRGRAARHGSAAFLGIPFAAPPVGALRWRPPVRAEAWEGTRDATRFGDAVPQVYSPGPLGDLFDCRGRTGPDCLNLNVWTPDPAAVGLPVVVWIHGGSFIIGSGADSIYDGSAFARDGVVAVTLNYRLGAAGFHHVGEDVPGSGCFGILDQIAALEWVQENIEAFGGDPARVTVAGESAGAMSVATLLGSPTATGLFRRAVLQSGAGHHSIAAESAARIGAELAAALVVGAAEATDEQVVAAQEVVASAIESTSDPARFGPDVSTSKLGWLPMRGGDVLPERAIDAIAAGRSSSIDVLLGTCRHESLMFLGHGAGLGDDPAVVRPRFDATFGERADAAYETYLGNRPGESATGLLSALETDRSFRIPAIRVAEAQVAAGASAHVFRFSWESGAHDGRVRAGHAVELPFVWDNLDDRIAIGLAGERAPQALADEVHGSWVRFVTDGDPGWPAYDLEARRVRDFGGDTDVVNDPDGDERRLWDGLI